MRRTSWLRIQVAVLLLFLSLPVTAQSNTADNTVRADAETVITYRDTLYIPAYKSRQDDPVLAEIDSPYRYSTEYREFVEKELKKVPAEALDRNLELYQELHALYPDNQNYKKKVLDYEEKIRSRNMADNEEKPEPAR